MNRIGIDKVILNIDLKECKIDVKKLEEINAVLMINANNTLNYRMMLDKQGDYVKVNYIKIDCKRSDVPFNQFTVGARAINEHLSINYNMLDVTLPRVLRKTNEDNISGIDELKHCIEILENTLQELGFGRVDIANTATFKEIEINRNIELKRQFNEYEQVIRYLTTLLPAQLKANTNKQGINAVYSSNNGQFSGIKVGNGSRTFKIYDKKENLRKEYDTEIEQELLRLEYRLTEDSAIKKALGTNKLKDLLEDRDFKRVNKAFKDALEGDLISKIYKSIQKQERHAKRHLNDYKKTAGARGQEYIFDYEVFDIGIVLSALRDIVDTKHYARECKLLIARCLEGKQAKLFGNIEKLNELLKALGYEPIELNMTTHIKKTLKRH